MCGFSIALLFDREHKIARHHSPKFIIGNSSRNVPDKVNTFLTPQEAPGPALGGRGLCDRASRHAVCKANRARRRLERDDDPSEMASATQGPRPDDPESR